VGVEEMTMSIEKLIAKGDHDGCCEMCDAPGMTNETVVEGNLGWYAENGDYPSDAWSRQWEGRQMGITG
jgi:hypothetical protein